MCTFKTVFLIVVCFCSFQRNSISPAEREKYRPRTPQESEHKKVKKEEKDIGHVSMKVRIVLNTINVSVFLTVCY